MRIPTPLRTAILGGVTLTMLAACGQKGPLHLPGQGKDTPWPSPSKPVTPPADPGSAGTDPAAPQPAPAPAPSHGGDALPTPPPVNVSPR